MLSNKFCDRALENYWRISSTKFQNIIVKDLWKLKKSQMTFGALSSNPFFTNLDLLDIIGNNNLERILPIPVAESD